MQQYRRRQVIVLTLATLLGIALIYTGVAMTFIQENTWSASDTQRDTGSLGFLSFFAGVVLLVCLFFANQGMRRELRQKELQRQALPKNRPTMRSGVSVGRG